MALGLFGVFGNVGVAGAGIIAAALMGGINWRAAFIVPGVVSVATGLVLVACIASGLVRDERHDRAPQEKATRADMIRAFFSLSATVFFGGLIYQSTQVALPKSLTLRLPNIEDGDVLEEDLFDLLHGVRAIAVRHCQPRVCEVLGHLHTTTRL